MQVGSDDIPTSTCILSGGDGRSIQAPDDQAIFTQQLGIGITGRLQGGRYAV